MSRQLRQGQVAAIYRYPVKSMQGETVDKLTLTERGIEGDRAVALRDVETGLIASAHHPAKWGTLLACAARTVDTAGIVVALPNGREMPIGAELEEVLSHVLGREVRLIQASPDGGAYEIVHPDVAGTAPEAFIEHTLSLAGPGATVGRLGVALYADKQTLVDVAPVHLITDTSLAVLTQQGADADVRRFRPNLVVSVEESGFVENSWAGRPITIGDTRLEGTFQTPRCIVPTLRQPGIQPDKRPLQILSRESRVAVGAGKWACLGLYANVIQPGMIRVGDPSQ